MSLIASDFSVVYVILQSWGDVVLPQATWIIPVSVAISTFGAANGSLFTGGRSVEMSKQKMSD